MRNMTKRMSEKEQIRKIYRNGRNSLNQEQVQEWSGQICERLQASQLYRDAAAVCFYYPLGKEVNLLAAAAKALEERKKVAFPKTEGDEIRFYQVENLKDFREGSFHVMEPVSDKRLMETTPLVLTPGLVFDRQKNRMGYGRGYYDRFAAGTPDAVKVGIAYEMQITEQIPVDGYDVPMDYILTEKGFR